MKSITIWRCEVEDEPGALAQLLGAIGGAGDTPPVVMGYRVRGRGTHAVLEVAPVSGRSMTRAARAAGLVPSTSPSLLIEAPHRPGLVRALAEALAAAGLNASFLVTQVSGARFSGVLGFRSATDTKRAASVLRAAARSPDRRRRA